MTRTTTTATAGQAIAHWANEYPDLDTTWLTMLTPAELVYTSGKPAKLGDVVAALEAGQPVGAPEGARSIPRSGIRAVDYQQGTDRVFVRDAAGARVEVFSAHEPVAAETTARELAAALGFTSPPSESAATVGSVTKGPVAVAVCVAVLVGIAYALAAGGDSAGGTGTRRVRTNIVKEIVGALGPGGVLAVGAALLGLCAAYWAFRVVKRPVVYSYGQPLG
jgi:hypothetical protein